MDYQKKLVDLKKSNQKRKLELAEKAGFSIVNDYVEFLLTGLKVEILDEEQITISTIHKVVLLDVSSSMQGSKICNAVKGINQEIEELKKEKDVNYIYSILTFGSKSQVNFKKLRTPLKSIENMSFDAYGNTALYDAIGLAINEFSNEKNKVLINVFTDGEENDSYKFNRFDIEKLINKYQHITVTFVGTERDVLEVQRNLKIEKSNTLSYDGSGDGLKSTMLFTTEATKRFSKSVSKGEDVSRGFYKKLN